MSRPLPLNPTFLPPTYGVLKSLLENPLKLPLAHEDGEASLGSPPCLPPPTPPGGRLCPSAAPAGPLTARPGEGRRPEMAPPPPPLLPSPQGPLPRFPSSLLLPTTTITPPPPPKAIK